MTLVTKEDFRRLTNIQDAAFTKIETYHDLLVKWNKAINLVSPKTLPEAWHRHFLDSAQIEKYLPEKINTLADLGCGGGFPGLVLAILRPDIHVHLVESDERKGQFMRTVMRETHIKNATVHTKRIENSIGDFTPDFVTARALASLDDLLGYVIPWAEKNPTLQLCFMKGKGAEEEILNARTHYRFDVVSHKSITDDEARILLIENLQKRL